MNPAICEAIKKRAVIAFQYKGSLRLVEPQCHGTSSAGNEVLRAIEVGDRSRSSEPIGKLFDVSKMSALKETGRYFAKAARNHNPADRAMTFVHCCLPRPRVAGKKTR
jgi:hypothetical protein